MDFEGIAWIGNVYEKFETMCLEMEDAVYQDTVKYVENQVQTVGASVKKFYSEAVQDLASPSAKTQEQLADKTLSVYSKPNAVLKKGAVKTDEQLTEDSEAIPVAKQDCKPVFSGCQKKGHPQLPSSASLAKREGFGLCLDQNEDNCLYRFSSGNIKKTLTNSHTPSETSRSITLQSDNLSKLPSCCSERDSYGLTFEQNSSGREDTSCSNIGASAVCTNNGSTDTTTSEPISLVESSLKKQARSRCSSSSGTCEESGIVSLTKPGSSGNPEHSGAAGDVCLLPPGDDNLDIIENVHVLTESDTEEFDELNVEGSCVIVNRDFFLVHDTRNKSRSYKKKIKKAFSSKRSAIKKEYEQLAVQHGHIDAGSRKESEGVTLQASTRNAVTKEPSTHHVCETDWELL